MSEAERKRAEAMALAVAPDWDDLDLSFQRVLIESAEANAHELDAYFAHTRFVREVAGTTYRLKPEPIEE